MDDGQSVTSFGGAEIRQTWSGTFLHLSVNCLSFSVPFSTASENSSSSRSTSRHLSFRSSFSFPLPLLAEDDAFCSPDKTCDCNVL